MADGVVQQRRQEKGASYHPGQEEQQEPCRRNHPDRLSHLHEPTSRRYPNPRIVLILKE